MTDPEQPFDELPECLRDVVAGIADEPVPVELAERIRERLRHSPPRPVARRPHWRLAVTLTTASAAAVAVIAALLRDRPSPVPSEGPRVVGTKQEDAASDLRELDAPSLWAYHRAAASSFEAFDALLNRHAAIILPPETDPYYSLSPHPFRSFQENL